MMKKDSEELRKRLLKFCASLLVALGLNRRYCIISCCFPTFTLRQVMGPLGPMGFKLGERERREFLSFALADLQNVPVVVRYDILKCRSTISRYSEDFEMIEILC